MEEEKNVTTDTEDLKKETVETVEKVKESFKDMNLKDETENAKGFIKDMVKDPIKTTGKITKDNDNKYLKTSLFILLIWVLAEVIYTCGYYFWGFSYYKFFNKMMYTIKAGIAPILAIVGLTLIIYLLNKKNKKSLTTIFSTVTTVYLPIVIVSILNLICLVGSSFYKIISPLANIASIITIILSYFALKDIFEEKTELGAFKKFVLVQAIYFVVAFVISFLGISIYFM